MSPGFEAHCLRGTLPATAHAHVPGCGPESGAASMWIMALMLMVHLPAPFALQYQQAAFSDVTVTAEMGKVSPTSDNVNLDHNLWHGYFTGPKDWSGIYRVLVRGGREGGADIAWMSDVRLQPCACLSAAPLPRPPA